MNSSDSYVDRFYILRTAKNEVLYDFYSEMARLMYGAAQTVFISSGFIAIFCQLSVAGFSSAAYFHGSSDNSSGGAIQIPFNTGPDLWPNLTWGAWVKPNSVNSIRDILNNDDGGYDRCLNIDQRAGGNYAAFVNNGPNPYNSGVAPVSGTSASDPWVLVAGVYQQNFYGTGQGKLTMYVGSQVFDDIRTNYGSTSWTYSSIGASPTFGEYWSGMMDDVFVYGGALTPSQMQDLQSGGPASVPEPSTYALGLIASGVMAFVARRRKRQPKS